jgi:hypothetical protein
LNNSVPGVRKLTALPQPSFYRGTGLSQEDEMSQTDERDEVYFVEHRASWSDFLAGVIFASVVGVASLVFLFVF